MTATLARLPETPYLLSIPLVAPVTAAMFLGAIGDPRAYGSAREVLKVAGLALVERSSGILVGQKRISKRGRPALRAAAYMFAVRSIRQGGLFRAEFDGLVARNGGKRLKAVVAVTRSALRLLFSIARDRRPFTVSPPPPPGHHGGADVRPAAQDPEPVHRRGGAAGAGLPARCRSPEPRPLQSPIMGC